MNVRPRADFGTQKKRLPENRFSQALFQSPYLDLEDVFGHPTKLALENPS
jgi:hypothetical protein